MPLQLQAKTQWYISCNKAPCLLPPCPCRLRTFASMIPPTLPTSHVISGRKSWRKTKERTETIWSPILESALCEALDKYRLTSSRQNTQRPLIRFPSRNKFISDHIFSVTGTRRTPKQVGSRLQQMRERCQDERIRSLVHARPGCMEPQTPSDCDSDSMASSQAVESVSDVSGTSPPRTFVTIELIQRSGSLDESTEHTTVSTSSNHLFISLQHPASLERNDPVVTFSTPHKLCISQHYSYFRVFLAGLLVHSEITDLIFSSTTFTPPDSERHTYEARLIPQYWPYLCRTSQLFQCVIEHDIMKTPATYQTLPTAPNRTDQSIRSVTYEFSANTTPRSTAPALHHMPSLSTEPALPSAFPAVEYSGYNARPSAPQALLPRSIQEPMFYNSEGFFAENVFLETSFLGSYFDYTLAPDQNSYHSPANPTVYTSTSWSNAPMYSELYSNFV
ncbi:TEA domain-containing protein [Favolaschia claudopus]|uniref:TEA domain-containing protein n=1 Tax=Favolaschia claudopus TaxID=2862362 RepID=A0AAW0BZ45_9AGAR